jgi:rare lipoprotein A
MKSISFRTARTAVTSWIQLSVAAVLILGLAMSTSARGGAPTATVPTTITTGAKATVAPNPVAKRKPKSQIGVASWYGWQFQGRKTAAGERFDMNSMTCAHPTLPMGTWLRVTNLKNRRTAFVRVNDRGPIIEGRIVDLSFAAAQMLGMPGLGKVKLEMVRDDDPVMAKELMAQVQVPMLFGSPIR